MGPAPPRADDGASEWKPSESVRAILECMPNGVLLVDTDGEIRYASANASAMFGWADHELVGRNVDTLVPDSYRDTHVGFRALYHDAPTRRAMGGGRDFQARRRDGSEFPAQIGLSPFHIADGTLVLATVIDVTDRKAAEENLRKSQMQLRLLVEQAPVAIAMFDRELAYLAISQRWIVEYERGRSDLVGRRAFDVHPELSDEAKAALRRGLSGDVVAKDDDCWTRSDGTTFWVRWAVHPWTDERGEIGGLIIAFEDITPRKLAEESLRESEARFATVFHFAPAGIVLTRLSDDVMVDANEAFLRLVGHVREDLVGHTASELAMWPDPGERERVFAAVRTTGRVQGVEVRFRRGSGEIRHALVSAELIELKGEAYLLGMIDDITETKRAEEQLRASEGRFRTLVDQAADSFFVHQLDGRIVDVNRHACEALGYTRDELLGLHVTDIEEDFDAVGVRSTGEALRPGEAFTLNGHHRRKDGSVFPVELRVGRIEIEGQPLVIALARDVSQRRELALVAEANRRLAREVERHAHTELELAKSLAHAEHQARTDALTGVASRAHFLVLAENELARSQRYARPMSLLMCDLDHFKGINDAYGHAAGDSALRAFADACREVLRSVDAVGRLGGEEFAVVLPETERPRALVVAERLRAQVAGSDVPYDSAAFRFTVSIGVSALRPGETLATLLKRADGALYDAKTAGRNRIEAA